MSIRCYVTAILAGASVVAVLSQVALIPLIAQGASTEPARRATSESEERVLRAQWRRLFDTHSWTELDSLANRLRSQRLRFQGGGWQLHVLYTVLSTVEPKSDTGAAWESQISALQEWILRAPSSPTPRIALADAYENFAWEARGGDFADQVTEQGWRLFGERMQSAHKMLEQAERIRRGDPEWYNSMLVASAALDWNSDKAEALVDESLREEPGYYYIARIQADNLLPKWYGEPGDTDRFVAKVADRIGGAEGDATYFFVAEYILTAAEKCIPCEPPTLSWARIRRGYTAIEHLYGTNNFEKNAYAFLAVHAGDRETASQAFEVIGDNWNPEVWGSKARFEGDRLFPSLKPVPLAHSKGASSASAPATLPELLSQFRAETDRAAKEKLLMQITTKYPKAGPDLLVLAKGPENGETKWMAIRGIGYLKFADGVPFLESSLNSSAVFVRANSARSLGEIGDEAAIDPLIDALSKEQDSGVIEQTALALEMLHAKTAIPVLKTKIGDPSSQTRIWILGAIESLGGRTELPFIAASLQDSDMGVREYAAMSMQRLSGQNFGFPTGDGVHVGDDESGVRNAERWWSNHKQEWRH